MNILSLVSGGKDSVAAAIALMEDYPDANILYVAYKAKDAPPFVWPPIDNLLQELFCDKDFSIVTGVNMWDDLGKFIIDRGQHPNDYYVATGEADFLFDYVDYYPGLSKNEFIGIFCPLLGNKKRFFSIHETYNTKFTYTGIIAVDKLNLSKDSLKYIGAIYDINDIKKMYDTDRWEKYFRLQSLVLSCDKLCAASDKTIKKLIDDLIDIRDLNLLNDEKYAVSRVV